MKEPKTGWHDTVCYKCGKRVGRMIHFGGKRRIKNCEWCKEIKSECIDCFVRDNFLKVKKDKR